jgi:hypothetical protein
VKRSDSGSSESPLNRLAQRLATRISSSLAPVRTAPVVSIRNGGSQTIPSGLPMTLQPGVEKQLLIRK